MFSFWAENLACLLSPLHTFQVESSRPIERFKIFDRIKFYRNNFQNLQENYKIYYKITKINIKLQKMYKKNYKNSPPKIFFYLRKIHGFLKKIVTSLFQAPIQNSTKSSNNGESQIRTAPQCFTRLQIYFFKEMKIQSEHNNDHIFPENPN